MDDGGLWRLFFQTGLPQAYLAIRGEQAGRAGRAAADQAQTAFAPEEAAPRQV